MKKELRKDFYWGGSVSSFQTEGHRYEDGKGLCIYDIRKTAYSDFNDGIDEYVRYDEDIEYMKQMHFNFYRFSICWARIIPNGTLDEPVNSKGIAFYNSLIDRLLKAGIEPMITLVHFDMPYYLVEHYNGFGSRYVVDCFERYAKVCMENFGDRVKHWMSFNEQNLHSSALRYSNAEKIPAGTSYPKHLYQVAHNVMIAHCKAVKALRELVPDGKFCGMGAITNVYSYDNNPANVLFADKAYNYLNGYLVDVFSQGKYPNYYLTYLENRGWLMDFESEDEQLLKYTVDYIAFSYYRSNTVKSGYFDNERPASECVKDYVVANPNLKANEWGWEIDPDGFRWTLNDLYRRSGLPVFVLENGIGLREDMSDEQFQKRKKEHLFIEDDLRIEYHRDHIKALKKAVIEDGVNCLGYVTWGPIDILASMGNMDKRYGFVYVNRTNDDLRDMARMPKKSFYYISKVFGSNGKDLD